MDVYWYLVPRDGFYPWSAKGARKIDFGYIRQVATAVDYLGYTGALLATGGGAHDAWVMGASLIPLTKQMKFIIAVHPGIVAPLMLAQKAATFDQFSDGRLILNIITGESHQMPPYGIYEEHDDRYRMTDEYWSIYRRLIAGERVDFEGEFFSLRGAELSLEPAQKFPPLFYAGSSPAALAVAAKHADTYLTWGEPPDLAAEKIGKVRALAAARGRDVKFGIRLNVIVRETKAEAWAAAQWLMDRMDPEAIAFNRANALGSDSHGQKRMNALIGNGSSRRAQDWEIAPDLWAGYGLIRTGPGTAIVGDPETVAARIREYEDVGFDTFIISGQPLLEEAYRVADLLLPLLPLNTKIDRPADPRQRELMHATGFAAR
jgi:alkanesulfonate monooxygenase